MRAFLLALAVLVTLGGRAYAGQPGDTLFVQGVCSTPAAAKVVAEAIVADRDSQEVREVALNTHKCIVLPMAAEVILDKAVGRVPGTNGRGDLVIWRVKNAAGHTWYALELDGPGV